MPHGDEDTGRCEPSLPGTFDPGVLSALELGLTLLLGRLDDDIDKFHVVLKETLSESLAARGYADWAERLRDVLKGPLPPRNSSATDVAKAIGQALGRICGSNPVEMHLRLCRHVLECVSESLAEFERVANAALHETAGASLVLVSTLRKRSSDFASNPHCLVDLHLGDIERLKTIEPATSRVQDIWEARPYVPLFIVQDDWAFDLLRRADLPAYLEVLEELPHMEFARQIISKATESMTSDDLAQLVRLTPAVLDDAGVPDSGVPLVMFALAACVKRWFGGERYHPQSVLNGLVKDAATFETESSLVLQTLAERADHRALGYAWLQYLIGCARSRRTRQVGSDDHSSGERWFALISQLAGALPIHPKPYEWIQNEQSLWRNERIYALLAVLIFRSPINAEDIAQFLKTCLTRGIVTTHAVQELQFKEQPCNFAIVGLAVASINDPVAWFKDLWAAIYLQRERTRRYRGDPNDELQNVGLVAVFWTLAGLAQLPADSPDKPSLWVEVESAVRESAMTDAVRTASNAWCVAALYVAAYWKELFPDDPAKGLPGSLDDFLLNWAKADADFALLLAELVSHGVTAKQFSRSIDGELVRAAFREARLLREAIRKPMPAFDLEQLATAIDGYRPPKAELTG